MMSWSDLPGGYDFSHWNGAIDWDVVAATKPAFIGLKATEGARVDPMFEANRRACADRDLVWVPYPFLSPTDNQAVVRNFLSVVDAPTVPAALDWERAGVPASVMELWINMMPRQPLAYYGRWPPAAITQKIARCPRWYPQYPGRPDAPPALPPWDGKATTNWTDKWLIWQWSERGRVPGTSDSPDDLDRLACSAAVFRRWYDTGVLDTVLGGPHPNPPPLLITRTLRLNMTGSDVGLLQSALVAKGFVVRVDNAFGPATKMAVMAFQTKHHLDPIDGIAGAQTLAALAA